MKAKIRLIAMAMMAGIVAEASVVMDWITVGNAGNAADTTGLGAVGYTYRISAYEVRNDQYAEFLNAVAVTDPNSLYSASMDITRSGSPGSYTYTPTSGFAANPVNYVSFLNSMRFANWLENGQPTGAQGAGTTEAGVYTIGTGINETRSGTASFFLPSRNEWYKAAYYDPRAAVDGGPTGDDNYWLYPTQSDTQPTFEAPAGGANSINFGVSSVGDTSDVGAYTGTTSYYGGFDLAGNVYEWNEAINGSNRGLWGGSWNDGDPSGGNLKSSSMGFGYFNPATASPAVGFRVASSYVVPEPGTLGLIAFSSMIIYALRRRKFSAA